MTITFRNKTTVEVSQQIAEMLRDTIIAGTAKKFQFYSDAAKDNELIIGFNIDEIVSITPTKTEPATPTKS